MSKFIKVPTKFILDTSIKPSERIIYEIIASLSISKGYCWAKQKTLSELSGYGRTQIHNAINSLAEKNWLKINSRNQKIITYTPLDELGNPLYKLKP